MGINNETKIDTILSEINELKHDEKEKLSKSMKVLPRCISLAVIKNYDNKILVDTGFDAIKNQKFYRPLGGGLEFGERSSITIAREFKEETNKDIIVQELLGTIENIFKFENEKGHEIIFIYKATFKELKDFDFEEITVSDKGRKPSKAVWRSIEEIKGEKSKLYPDGLEELLKGIKG